jgi:hypothetical protein
VDAESVERITEGKRATFTAVLLVGGEEKHREDRTLAVSWGRRRFAVSGVEVDGERFRFSVAFTGAEAARGHVFVSREVPEGQEIGWNWSNVAFPPGKKLTFEGRRTDPGAELKAILVAEGGRPEVVSLWRP